MKIVPCFQKQAKQFIGKFHRHNVPSLTSVFNIGLQNDEGELIGVAMAGLPKARLLMDGVTLEVTRVCVLEGNRNANSMLYGACARAAKGLGFERLITYTLENESGSSLRAAGWLADEELSKANVENWVRHGGKGTVDIFGETRIPQCPKIRWKKEL